jgi:hypothetical protein
LFFFPNLTGNEYSFRNVCKKKVTLMFAQARLLREEEDIDQGEGEAEGSATPAPTPAQTAPAKQVNGKRKRALETEEASGEPEHARDEPPVKEKKAARGGGRK